MLCGQCSAITVNQAGAPGHDNLISLGLVRSLPLAQRGVTHEAFTCGQCGANWDYLHDRRNRASGWTRCDRTMSAPQLPINQPAVEVA
ncbi:hypothetical protein [Achromobacter spanius]|uniref:hypothetical protein n=1 Tax=Achromobacter spanius TaxID=217203 RepID=UPI0038147A98